jgi:hypothetical protein
MTAVAVFLACCKSPAYNQGNMTAADIQTTADRMAVMPDQINKTMASLNDLVQNPQADLRPQYEQFAANLDQTDSLSKEIATARKAMGEKGKEYLARWDEQIAQIQNPDIKARSQARRDDVAQRLMAIKAGYTESCSAFKPLMADLTDVQKYLSVDLTTAGIATIKDPVAKASRDAVPLNASLTQTAADFKALGVAMSSVTPQEVPQ